MSDYRGVRLQRFHRRSALRGVGTLTPGGGGGGGGGKNILDIEHTTTCRHMYNIGTLFAKSGPPASYTVAVH